MEVEIEAGKKILEQCLSSEEYGKLDTSVIKKIEIFFEDKFNDFLTAKALAETEKTNYNDAKDNYTRQICELNYQLQEFENKLENSKNCVGNLRDEITQLTSEKNSINETLQKYTNELNECRNHRKIVTDERDSLLRMVERKTSEVERLQSELQMIQGQMKAAIEAKCDAVIKYDTVRSKEISLEMKEKRMEQEKMLYANQIKVLTEDLNRNIAEVQSVRRENTIKFMQLQSKLSEKNEEVNILISENSDLKESNTKLNNQLKKLNDKFLTQSTETQRMIDNYKKEMAAKTKLTELYKLNVQSKSDETQELETAVTDMKRMLAEASEQYGKLETTHKAVQVQHEQDLEEKNKAIEELKNELKHANELIQEFKEESVENALGKLAPSAAVVKRLINSDMSLTELYSKYREASEESESLKLENSKLTLQLNTILQELEERAPAIKKQELEYNKLVVSNQELCQQLETMIMEKSAGNHELSEAVAKSSHLERENKKLKLSQNDLARQVCYLLKEMEQIRCGFTNSHHSDQNDLSTDEVISKKLVTFSSIQELQENNQKLILLVRDLSNKLEEIETIQSNINESAYQTKIDTLKKKLLVMQESYDSQTKMLTTYINKCDSLKKMCFEVFTNDDKAAMFTKDGEMMVDGDSTLNRMSNSKNASEIQEQQKRISELEQQLEDLKGQLRKSKDEYEEYIKEKRQNDKVMNEQLDCLRSEVHELTTTNCKLKTSLDYNNEQLKLQNKNIDTYRKQIAALEERKKNYENSTAKQDETIMYLKEEAMNAHRKLSSYEIQVDTLKQEVRVLRDSEARWHAEREGFHRERQTNNLLLNNIEMIKANFERSETEGKARLESRLDECMRETSALRRRLQEEQDNFRQMTADLKRETEKAKARMEEEKTIADQLRNEIQECRQELEQKSKQIQDLSSKLQESLTPSQNDNPIVQANKKARDLEIKLQEANLEIESITKELEKARENALVYCNISTKSEKELMHFMESQKDYKQKAEAEIEKLKSTEQTMQSRINELETQLKLQHTTVQMTQQNVPAELQRLQEDYKLTLEKLNACNMEIRNLREQNKTVANNLQSAEQKYAHEMMLHSADIQELSKMKEEFSKLQEKLSTSTISDTTKDLYEESKKLWDESKKLLELEKIELEKRIEDLDHQNTVLHDQLQAWSAKQMAEIEDVNMSAQLSESIVADLNSSAMDIDSKGSDKLVEIIKFLRKEKDLALGQVDILKAEKVRILSESQILQKKAEEMEAVLKEEKAKAESEIVTAYKHGEILRKVEMLNAVTDSNRVLREERDTLTSKVKDLSDQLTLAEDEIVPLKEKNRELSTKVDTYMSENTSLRSEAARWRQRANTVLNNKNSEEFKQITNERDNLLKMLNTEKEILKQVNDELQELKSQRTNVDGDLANLQKQLATLTEEKKKFSDEVISLRTQIQAINKELTESKASQIQKDKDLLKLSADLEAKDAALQDIKAKEFQIRGIAKRYKQNYIDLKSKYPDDDSNVGETSGTAGALNTNEESRNQVNELNSEIQTLRQQEESLRKENEEMKSTNEKTKTLLREAKSRILNLTQSKESLQQELNNHKAQFDAFRQSHETIKSKFDETESSLKESVAKLSRENEALRTFNRQVTKPSTSTGVIQEKSTSESASPRTANVKPMSGGSTPNVGQQSATVQPWRGSSGETPLASIRPITVQNTRTAAILPSQIGQGPSTSSSAGPSSAVPGTSSSSSSNTALVPPQQQVHTTGNNIEPMSSSPTSSHTDYMPATSSATVVVVAVQPMGSASAESSTEAEQQQQQQAVALVSPRMESGNVVAAPAQVGPENQQETSNNQPSTSGTASGSTSHNISISHHHASSSNSVTTTHAGGAGASHKRPRETESEAANNTEDGVDKGPVAGPSMTKRTRTEVTESGVEVEYQVPTSSQREYDSITVDSDEEDGCISEENNAEMDEGNGEGENEGYDEGYEQNQEDMDDVEEGDQSNDIDQSNVQAGDNEVETSSENADEIMIEADAQSSQVEAPQIQAISSGSSEVESSWRQAIPSTSAGLSRQQQATLLMLQKGCNETDGGSSEVSQAPQIQKSDLSSQATTSSTTNNVVQQRKVSGGEPIPGPSSEVIPGDSDVTVGELVDANGTGNDDEQPTNAAAVQVVYQSEEEGNRTNDGSLQAPKQKEDGNSDNSKTDQGCSGGVKGESETAQKVPASVVISENSDNMDPTQSAGDRPAPGEAGAEEGEGMDGVTSEGEKVVLEIEDAPEIEEGREAEASTSSLTTRSRANAAAGSSGINRAVTTTPRARGTNQRGHRGGRPTPIIWSGHQGGIQQGSPQRIYAQQPAQPQRGAGRGRRMRRPGANNFSNMRY